MDENDGFYVVRKGDIVGVYKYFVDYQDQAGSSVLDPSMTVHKGYCLTKEAEEYLDSHGLKNATYSINASHVTDKLFGKVVACPIQQRVSNKGKELYKDSPQKTKLEVPHPIYYFSPQQFDSMGCIETVPTKHLKSESSSNAQQISTLCDSCILKFNGVSKGNPGQSGAGAVLRAKDGSMVYRLQEGVGHATSHVAVYRAVILGLRYALKKGFKHICVQGNSKFICMQIQGLCKIRNPNMADLYKVALELKDKFLSFQIEHIPRELNSEADAQANLALHLKDGEIEAVYGRQEVVLMSNYSS